MHAEQPEPDYDAMVRDFLAELGLPEKRVYFDEAKAPEVDEDVLRRLARRELTPEEVHVVLGLVHQFESWRRAFAHALAVEFRRREEESL